MAYDDGLPKNLRQTHAGDVMSARRDAHALVRAYLQANPDGAHCTELAAKLNMTLGVVGKALAAMPDVYIDRWIQRRVRRMQAVHVAVPVPEDCPPPALRGRTKPKKGTP